MLSGVVATDPDHSIVHSLNQWFSASSGRIDLAKALAVIPLFVIVGLVVLAWFLDWGARPQRRAFLILGVGGAILALVGNQILSHFYFRPRPFVAMPHVQLLISHSRETSMYSDHLAAAGGLVAGLLATRRWILAGLGVVAAILMAVARVGAGLHYPSDVVVGFVAGVVGFLILLPARNLVTAGIRPIARLEGRLTRRRATAG